MVKAFHKYIKAFLALKARKFILKELAIAKSGFLAFVKLDFLDFVDFNFLNLVKFDFFAKFAIVDIFSILLSISLHQHHY